MELKWRYIFEGGKRRLYFLIFDMIISIFSYACAFWLRFGGEIPAGFEVVLPVMFPLILIVRVPCYVYGGLYQTLWRYFGSTEIFAIIKSVTAGSLFILLLSFLIDMPAYTRSVFIIDWLILVMILGGSRLFFKMLAERLRDLRYATKKNVLILGAEDMGEHLVREFIKRPELGYKPIGFLDNQSDKIGMRIHGIKVLGKLEKLVEITKIKKIDEVIIALPKISGHEMREIVFCLNNLGISHRIIPNSSLLIKPDVLPLKLRRVEIADLLGRELIQEDPDIHEYLKDKTVLVTGAGGSIGSELCRVMHSNHVKELILVDYSEKYLHDMELELAKKSKNIKVSFHMADITNAEGMERIFSKYKPDIVYHAAACKQVPFVESHFSEGIQTNVFGTKVAADLSLKYGVKKFVLISTDKAINPKSIMGATKRIAELYTQSLNGPGTKFLTVRFGNVFNSNGSAIPLFKKQIEEGGPVTITHPEMTRYFMDVSEAVYLILKATILGNGSEIFILDMGKPVRILNLARDLIRLMGLREDQIPIHYIGLRPGEKMHEEIESQAEESLPTEHKKIRIWVAQKGPDLNIKSQTEEMRRLLREAPSKESVIEKLKEIVPEYTPFN